MAAAYGRDRTRYAQGSPFVAGLPLPVSRTALGQGVTATFYRGTDFARQPIASRTDLQLDVNWNWIAPAPGVDPSDFSARFSGTITPPEPGIYRFALERRPCDPKAAIERYAIPLQAPPP